MANIFDDDELNKEHEALQEIANIIARKWKGDLEETECAYSVEGIFTQFPLWKDDIEALNILWKQHKKRVEEYREKKRNGSNNN